MIQQLGKYRIIELVGRGGLGTVYKAHDPMLDRTVALSQGPDADSARGLFKVPRVLA